MNPHTRKKLQYVVVASAACLLTVTPWAMAQSGTAHERGSMHQRGAKEGDASRIRRAQEALKSEGHDPGPADGVMGPKTQEALRQFQKQENIRETGRLDQATMSKLGV